MNRAAKVIIALFVLLILAVAGAGYFFWQYKKAQTVPADTGTVAAAQEVAQTVALIAAHVVLPEGETPTVATITDTSTLAGQEFFKNAKVGDKVIVYPNARTAILYDPTLDRIVNMAQISPTSPDSTVSPSASQEATPPEGVENSTQ
jgi:uncharacterized membrane protein